MSAPLNPAVDGLDERPAPQAVPMRSTRPYLWSVRRELWEHRAVFTVPLIAAGVVLFGFVLSMRHIPPNARNAFTTLGPMQQTMVLLAPHYFAAGVILVTSFIVAVFYCLGALVNERRDRSILFWKSLPVSDVVAVLSKASIPLLVLPVVVVVTVVATQLVILAIGALVLSMNGDLDFLGHLSLVPMWAGLVYTVIVTVLWHAPIYGWLLLVSAYAKRNAFLWAIVPPFAVVVLETIATGTSYAVDFIKYRVGGFVHEAFTGGQTPFVTIKKHGQTFAGSLPQIDPARFLTTPGLWLGLVAAAIFLAGAVWLRRYREPI